MNDGFGYWYPSEARVLASAGALVGRPPWEGRQKVDPKVVRWLCPALHLVRRSPAKGGMFYCSECREFYTKKEVEVE